MCTHALRDHCDGRLVSLLIYAADWLVRQDYYQLTGVWTGRQIGRGGRLLINGHGVDSANGQPSRKRHATRRQR